MILKFHHTIEVEVDNGSYPEHWDDEAIKRYELKSFDILPDYPGSKNHVSLEIFGGRSRYKPTIALDFDGVLHQYTGWNEGKMGAPIPGAQRGVKTLLDAGAKVVIFTTRQAEMVESWLEAYEFPPLEIVHGKPAYKVLLDDRAVRFEGVWGPDVTEALLDFKPHWEAEEHVL